MEAVLFDLSKEENNVTLVNVFSYNGGFAVIKQNYTTTVNRTEDIFTLPVLVVGFENSGVLKNEVTWKVKGFEVKELKIFTESFLLPSELEKSMNAVLLPESSFIKSITRKVSKTDTSGCFVKKTIGVNEDVGYHDVVNTSTYDIFTIYKFAANAELNKLEEFKF